MTIALIQIIAREAFLWYDKIYGILCYLPHRRVYSNGALEHNIINHDAIHTQAFMLPPRNFACKAWACSHVDGYRHVGGHASRPADEAENDCRSYRHARADQ